MDEMNLEEALNLAQQFEDGNLLLDSDPSLLVQVCSVLAENDSDTDITFACRKKLIDALLEINSAAARYVLSSFVNEKAIDRLYREGRLKDFFEHYIEMYRNPEIDSKKKVVLFNVIKNAIESGEEAGLIFITGPKHRICGHNVIGLFLREHAAITLSDVNEVTDYFKGRLVVVQVDGRKIYLGENALQDMSQDLHLTNSPRKGLRGLLDGGRVLSKRGIASLERCQAVPHSQNSIATGAR